jgi:hypothetical protein
MVEIRMNAKSSIPQHDVAGFVEFIGNPYSIRSSYIES